MAHKRKIGTSCACKENYSECRKLKTFFGKVAFQLFIIFLTHITITASELSKSYIDSSFLHFEKYLSNFPLNVKDSIEAKEIEIELITFIEQINQSKNKFSPYLYNYYLGRLYYFGFNLDIDSGWNKCEYHLLQAIELEPDSIKPKLELAALYGNSFHPQDTLAYKRAYFSLNMLSELRTQGKDVEYPFINYNLCLTSLTLGIQSLCFDAGYEFWKQMPKDSSANSFKGLFEYKKGGCSNLSAEKYLKTYVNRCFDFKITYPDTLILHVESTDTSKEYMTILNLGTPLVQNSENKLIRNAISVSAWNSNKNDKAAKIGGIIRRFSGGRMLARYIQLPHLRSTYEYVMGESPESFHAILTFLETKDNLYALMYVATNSTFEKNQKYFNDFERNFEVLPKNKDAKPSMCMPQEGAPGKETEDAAKE